MSPGFAFEGEPPLPQRLETTRPGVGPSSAPIESAVGSRTLASNMVSATQQAAARGRSILIAPHLGPVRFAPPTERRARRTPRADPLAAAAAGVVTASDAAPLR